MLYYFCTTPRRARRPPNLKPAGCCFWGQVFRGCFFLPCVALPSPVRLFPSQLFRRGHLVVPQPCPGPASHLSSAPVPSPPSALPLSPTALPLSPLSPQPFSRLASRRAGSGNGRQGAVAGPPCRTRPEGSGRAAIVGQWFGAMRSEWETQSKKENFSRAPTHEPSCSL